jgi:3-oxoacyl-[acyl-carrier-protein] synthase-3
MMDPAKLPRFVLMVGADSLTKTVDYNDRSAAVLWGDGAAAAVVSTREEGRAAFLGSELDSRPTAGDKVVVPRAGFFAQEGRTVQAFAIKKTREGFERLRSELSRPERPFHFIGHQANLRMLENVCRHCDIAPEQHHTNVEWFGNTGAASSATVISQRWEKWESRDDIAVVGVGAGLTWAGYLLRFGHSA